MANLPPLSPSDWIALLALAVSLIALIIDYARYRHERRKTDDS